MHSDNLSPSKHPHVFKELIDYNALSSQIKDNIQNQTEMSTKQVCRRIVSGRIVKRYNSMSSIAKKISMSRNTIAKHAKCKLPMKPIKQVKLSFAAAQLKQEVIDFYLRDDNSKMMPGKADYVKVDGAKVQKKVLTDYVYNIHAKFRAENPHTYISLSGFYKYRPGHVCLTKFCDRRTCLCQRHQNVALKLECLKKMGINVCSLSPDSFAEQTDDDALEELLDAITCDTVKLHKWVQRTDGTETRTVLVEVTMSTTDFKTEVIKDIAEFRGHVLRIKIQYKALKHKKANLKPDEVLVQMDFAQSHNCTAREAVQNSYFQEPKVTLHPVVVYNKGQHHVYVFTSDSQSHNAAAVQVIITKLMRIIKAEIVPNPSCVLYFTDSPTSQYRNATMFRLVANHKALFGCDAEWYHFEAGHGKGPCDGIGGTAKRLADQAVRSHGTLIHNAETFHAWASSSGQNMKYVLYSPQEVSDMKASQDADPALPVPGTMTVHAVRSTGNPDIVSVRDTACAGPECICDPLQNVQCSGWSDHPVAKVYNPDQWIGFKEEEDVVSIGQVQNQEGATLEVKCVELANDGSGLYQWSNVKEVNRSAVVCKLAKPTVLKRKNGLLRFTATTLKKIQT